MARGRSRQSPPDPKVIAFEEGRALLHSHPLFRALQLGEIRRDERDAGQWVQADPYGYLHANLTGKQLTPANWAWLLGHAALHLAMGHNEPDNAGGQLDAPWRAAACVAACRFLAAIRFGEPPFPIPTLPEQSELVLARRWRTDGTPPEFLGLGANGSLPDVEPRPEGNTWRDIPDWPALFAAGLAAAVSAAVEVAAGDRAGLSDERARRTPWAMAHRWFQSNYPLLGGLATGMEVVADPDLADSLGITIAAVDPVAGDIYVNPRAGLSGLEWRFVLAHEMLHAGLRHGQRVGARDPYLWNVAADYVINDWLIQMGVGDMPDGLLHDPQLTGSSVEEVYDRIARDLRRLRKLATLRGQGQPDMLGRPDHIPGEHRRAEDLEAFYRRALTTGLAYHRQAGRGVLPAALEQEIRALDQPPLPWDAALARWFEEFVPSPLPVRTYSRASRRQAATPEIPRPGWFHPEALSVQCTFGVVLDTSGSMNVELLGKALGAIASYSAARDVPAARVVFCDAAAYDAGYLPVEAIAGRVRVRGRGGTILQPGVNLLEAAPDFPPNGPILVITDAQCDPVRIRREHAFLVPEGALLPFTPRGPVFRMS